MTGKTRVLFLCLVGLLLLVVGVVSTSGDHYSKESHNDENNEERTAASTALKVVLFATTRDETTGSTLTTMEGLEWFAAKETRRYLYLLTDALHELKQLNEANLRAELQRLQEPASEETHVVLFATKQR